MRILEKYTGNKTYRYPNGILATPERIKSDNPAVDVFEHVIETNESGEVCFSVQNLDALKSAHGVPLKTDIDTAIKLLQEKINEPPPEVVDQNELITELINKLEQQQADMDYLSIMTGVEL